MRLSAPALGGSDSLSSCLQAGCPSPVFLTALGLDGVEQTTVYCTGSLIFMVGPLVWFSFKLLPESFDYFAEQNEG